MAYKAKKVPATRKPAGNNKKGSPQNTQRSKASVKVPDVDNLEENEQIGAEYLEGEDEIANNVIRRNPNRNYNKPDIDKPAYS